MNSSQINKKLFILDRGNSAASSDNHYLSFEEFEKKITISYVGRHFGYYDEVVFSCSSLASLKSPFIKLFVLRALSKKEILLLTEDEAQQTVSWLLLWKHFFFFLYELIFVPLQYCRAWCFVFSLFSRAPDRPVIEQKKRCIYIKTDIHFQVQSGGSVTHVAGVLNNFFHAGYSSLYFSIDENALLKKEIQKRKVLPRFFWNFPNIQRLSYVREMCQVIRKHSKGVPRFIYQRYSIYDYTGLCMSRELQTPLVLEYNGSEVWIQKHWGSSPARSHLLALSIENLNLQKANLVVVVSEPLRDELLERGVEEGRILVNPNGVDPEMFSPECSGAVVRERYRLKNFQVVGFIGTFGKWHGAEVLVEAFGKLVKETPQLLGRVKLFMIGDGLMRKEAESVAVRYGIEKSVVFSGLVPQREGPEHLAACDILVAPHVPNSDGSKFFGSPTKLFEYMAMGKAIVASDLDQIGEVLSHQKTAWMVKPGSSSELQKGIQQLLENQELASRLGTAARAKVIEEYTWEVHTKKILNTLLKIQKGE